jgi:signal transduction histidine kinase
MPPAGLPIGATELDAALLQAVITAALTGLCIYLYRRFRKPHLAWWSVAWGLYVARVGAISSFLVTGNRVWLYWHQVITGWTALGILWAALVFSRQMRWRPRYLLALLFPPLWSYVAIYRLDQFILAAGPMVLFLSLATMLAGWSFYQHHRAVKSPGARLLAIALGLWALHHLDYPFLRARGAWSPWGYYLDILFELAVGAGIVLLVVDDLRRGVDALSTLSEQLQQHPRRLDVFEALLEGPLRLPGVRGSALYLTDTGRFVRGAGNCATWTDTEPADDAAATVARAVVTGQPQVTGDWADVRGGVVTRYAYAAVLPVYREQQVNGALVLVGDARDPFTALDDGFLRALGQQVGAALENAGLYERLEARTVELARLSSRMVAQHEEERRRLSRELHDETAQVFSAVKMQLGSLRPSLPAAQHGRLDRAVELVDAGIRSIRSVTNDLRPSLLDDIGLLPALRSLATECTERSGIPITLVTPDLLPALSKHAELALYRALQEAISNVMRHAGAAAVHVTLASDASGVRMTIADDGRGLPLGATPERFERDGHMGLAGMRERISALGGTVQVTGRPAAGTRLDIRIPLAEVPA